MRPHGSVLTTTASRIGAGRLPGRLHTVLSGRYSPFLKHKICIYQAAVKGTASSESVLCNRFLRRCSSIDAMCVCEGEGGRSEASQCCPCSLVQHKTTIGSVAAMLLMPAATQINSMAATAGLWWCSAVSSASAAPHRLAKRTVQCSVSLHSTV